MNHKIANLLYSLTYDCPTKSIFQYKPKYITNSYLPPKDKKYLEDKLDRTTIQTIQNLLTSLYMWHPSTGRHSIKVANIAFSFANAIGLSCDAANYLYFIGLLHDIGKMSIPKHILNKPAKLALEEYKIIKQHSSRGADIVRQINDICHLADIIRHHHERYDGTGYPERLVGEEIPLFSRIIALCDSYEAITGQRCYRRSVSVMVALDKIERCRYTQFDPNLAKVFITWIKQEKPYSLLKK